MRLVESELEAKLLREGISRVLGRSFEEMLKELLAELRPALASSSGLPNPHSVAVGANAGIVLEANPRRIQVLLYNNGSSAIHLGGRRVTNGPIGDPNAGIPLLPNGPEPFVLERYQGELWAVAGTGGPEDLRLWEFLQDQGERPR